MESKSLAVRYRPTKLSEVFGQDNAIAVIEGMFKKKQFPSAILLSGTTGAGKTTIAQIFAKRVNCEKGTGCGKCMSCQFGDRHPDIVYHNAGTDGKIDDIRKLVQAAKVAPTTRKRVIILDEAHACTGASLQALLIPTESASKNTIWICCTTNPEKVANTLVNRCVRINVKPIDQEPMVARLQEIAEAEGCKVKSKEFKNALNMIAAISNGSLRDAISHLESLILALASGKKFDAEGAMAAFLADGEVDLERAAVELVGSFLDLNLTASIAAIRKANNARGILSKARWLVEFLIGVKTKTAKFTPYSGRLFKEMYPDLRPSLALLVMFQTTLVETELRMNSCSIDENVLLSSAIGKLIVEAKS